MEKNIARAIRRNSKPPHDLLEPMEPFDVCILLLGSSGCGKSTFVNTFINILLENTIENLKSVIASNLFEYIDDEFNDGIKEKNTISSGKSQTDNVHYYKIRTPLTKGKTILIIDTPGFNSTGGVEEDDKIVNLIINAVLRVKFITTVMFLERSSTNTLTAPILYVYQRMLQIIPKTFEGKVVLVLTYNDGISEFNEQWLPFKIVHTINLNNLAFSYNQHKFNKYKNLCIMEYENSKNNIIVFMEKLYSMGNTSISEYRLLFEIHNEIMKNILEYKKTLKNIDDVKEALKNSKRTAEYIEFIDTHEYHNTICSFHQLLCHEDCDLNFNLVKGSDYFNNCLCMDRNNICRICGCKSGPHTHMKKKPLKSFRDITKTLNEFNISSNTQLDQINELEIKKLEILEKLKKSEAELEKVSNFKITEYIPKVIDCLNMSLQGNDSKNNDYSTKKDLKEMYENINDNINRK